MIIRRAHETCETKWTLLVPGLPPSTSAVSSGSQQQTRVHCRLRKEGVTGSWCDGGSMCAAVLQVRVLKTPLGNSLLVGVGGWKQPSLLQAGSTRMRGMGG